MITDKNGNTYYKVALHLHSTLSDGSKTPEQIADEFKNSGYDAIALTDHWTYHKSDVINGMLIIAGAEYDMGFRDTIEGVMHIVGLGMKKEPALTKQNTRQQVVDAINEQGGVAVLAHPAWSLNTLNDARALSGIVATEIYNAVSEAHESQRAYSDHFVDACANAGQYYNILATDDAHYYDGTDSTKGFVMVKAKSLCEDEILNAIRNGEFYASQGPELYVTREGNTLKIDCSPCSTVGVLSNHSFQRGHTLRGENITHFEYQLEPTEVWARVQVIDKDGNHAWSNIFVK